MEAENEKKRFFQKGWNRISSFGVSSRSCCRSDHTRAGAFAATPGGQPADTFLILLDGPYEPVVHGPNLGLLQVNLSDGSYSTTKIYRVSELPGDPNRGNRADLDAEKENARIGNFYVALGSDLPVAYDLPAVR